MKKTAKPSGWALVFRVVGVIGTVACLAIFIHAPSFPTPDKLLVLMTFVAMIFGLAWQMLKRFLPFIGLLFIYESFRGIANDLNKHIHYTWMPNVDRWLFGTLPTAWLQQHWWHGYVRWYDFAFYTFYMLHFLLPIALGIVIWRLKDSFYWQYATSYVVLSFAGFLTYILFPAAPPWMASQNGYIQPITRISSSVWFAMGIHNFPSLYNTVSPNPVAAVPSLHAAYATLFVLIVYRLWGKKWALVSLIYPFMIILGTVYMGEHYAIDAILGIIYASLSFILVDLFFKRGLPRLKKRFARHQAGPA